MSDKGSREDRIRELEEKVRKLEERQGTRNRKRGGVASSVLGGLGEIIPGLGRLIEGLEDSEAFEERIEEINKEVDRRLRETPLERRGASKSGMGIGGSGLPRKGSIPRVERGFSIRTLAEEEPEFDIGAEKPRPKRERTTQRQSVEEQEIPVDIFEENEHLRIVADLPGVEEKDIKIEIKEDKLTITANTSIRKYYNETILPCSAKGQPKTIYRNGVLEIRIKKNQGKTEEQED